MDTIRRSFIVLLIAAIAVSSSSSAFAHIAAGGILSGGPQGNDSGIRKAYHRQTGRLTFLGADPRSPLTTSRAMQPGLTPQERGIAILEAFGRDFGLSRPSAELIPLPSPRPSEQRIVLRYQQVYKEIPVFGGELIVNLKRDGGLLSISGEISPELDLSIEPRLTQVEARAVALEKIAAWYGLNPSALMVSDPELWIFDERLLRPSTWPPRLVWQLEIRGRENPAIRELVLVDARNGVIPLHFNQVDLTWHSDPTAISTPDAGPTPRHWKPTNRLAGRTNSGFFTDPVIYDQVGHPLHVAIGDFNNDGLKDVVLTTLDLDTQPASFRLLVLLQTGEGKLQKTWSLSSVESPTSLAVGDLNNDGRDDLAVSSLGEGRIAVHLQDPNGGFVDPAEYITLLSPDSVEIGDVNSDGLNDLIASLRDSSKIGVLHQRQDGSLSPVVTFTSRPSIVNAIKLGDLNDDGRTDVLQITSDPTEASDFAVLYQTEGGDLLLSDPITVSPQAIVTSGVVGDVNGDGREDVTVVYGAFQPEAKISVVSQTESGELRLSETDRAYDMPESLKISDINGDGMNDLVVAHVAVDGTNLAVHLQAEDGSLATYELYGLPYAYDYTPEGMDVGDVTGDGHPDVVLVDWTNGLVVLPHAEPPPTPKPTPPPIPRGNRLTYSAENDYVLPGTLLCDQSREECTAGGDPHADAAHRFAGDAHAFFHDHHGRESFDDKGSIIRSSVHYGEGVTNAFWDGERMVYGDAYDIPFADDIVAHEYTHAVTQYESGLFYFYQSGAINESLSDLWGEFVDLTNGEGDDRQEVRWLIGEDAIGRGVVRNMADPTAFGHPDRMTSQHYELTDWDNGGVHINSGVNNKAITLMTDGGSFNGQEVRGLGIAKVAAIYYHAQTDLLTSGSDYGDLYQALYQACLNLIDGQEGISEADCQEVRAASEAVEMNVEPTPGFNPEATVCEDGMAPKHLFRDDFETDADVWDFGVIEGLKGWTEDSGYAASGDKMLWGDDFFGYNDSYAAISVDVMLPPDSQPYLHFNHAFAFEPPDRDGGWLEYSIDGGKNWLDAGSLFDEGKAYNGAINTLDGRGNNPHTGRPAFVGDSHGYVSSRYDLRPLAGQTVRFRWRISTDTFRFNLGWFIDDVRLYTCGKTTFTDVPSDHPYYEEIETLFQAGYIAGCGTNPLRFCPDETMNRSESAVFVVRGVRGVGEAPPEPADSIFSDMETGYWGLKWATALFQDGYTAGCGTDPLRFCPGQGHTRAEGAVFYLRMSHGSKYIPPEPRGIFTDVALGTWQAKWAEAAYTEGLIPACSQPGEPLRFCPDEPLSRGLAAYIMVQAKGLIP